MRQRALGVLPIVIGVIIVMYGTLIVPNVLPQALAQLAGDDEYECLTTPNGIPRKVIVKKQDAVAHENADFTGTRKPLKFFRKYFVFKESGQGFLVGEATREASTFGWVRKEEVIPWDNQQALFFVNKSGKDRVPVVIWREKSDIGKMDRPHFEEALDRDFTTEPFPILEPDKPYLRVAFLWDADGAIRSLSQSLAEGGGDQVNAKLLPGKEVDRGTQGKDLPKGQQAAQQILENIQRMDVVLVIDATGSMGAYMEQVRTKLAEIVDSLGRFAKEGPNVTIHVGVVAYRDYADESSTFLTKKLHLTKDLASVKTFFADTNFRPDGGAGRNEAVCDALYDACQMAWGDNSLRIVCLVGDAPPHTEDDDDIKSLKKSGKAPSSPFFGKSFGDCAAMVKKEMEKQRIRFFPISVGGFEDTEKAFRQLAQDPKRFLSLTDATSFIKGLEKELRETRTTDDVALAKAGEVAKGVLAPSSLTDSDLEFLRLRGIDDIAILEEMGKELIQTGWCQPKIGKDTTIAVYIHRRQLEDWADVLRGQLVKFREQKPDVFAGIVSMHTGDRFKGMDLNDLSKILRDLPAKPPLADPKYRIGLEDAVLIANLRRKLNNIMILLLNDKIFSDYEEGWVPMDYLPGSLEQKD